MPHNSMVQECIELCIQCHQTCVDTLDYCIRNDHTAPSHLRILLDTTEICQTTANFLMRNSDIHRGVCAACASTCRACASSCAQFDDEIIAQCARSCLECADSCDE